MRYLGMGLGLLVGLSALTGCGANCQSTCEKAFREDAPNCNIKVPGVPDQDDLIRDCVTECEGALTKTGDLDGYDPDQPLSGETFTLENEKQAAVWMDCVDQTACENLDKGVCPGGGIN